MERETRKVKLPKSGKTAEIIAEWTYGERQEIEASLYGATKPVYEGGEVKFDMNPMAIAEANKKAMTLAVRDIQDKDGKSLGSSWEVISDLPANDGKLLEGEVNKLTQDEQGK